MPLTSQKNHFYSASAASLFFAVNVFLYQPAMIYWGNSPFFIYPFWKIALWLLPLFLLSFFILQLPPRFFQNKSRYYTAFLSGLGLSMWVASFFSGTTGVLDGKTFSLIKTPLMLGLNGLLLLGVLTGTAFFAFYQAKLVQPLLFWLSGIAMVFIMMMLIMGQKPPIIMNSTELEKNLLTFSKEKNVLVLLLDTFESDFFQEILKRDPTLANAFPGFIYFSHATGVAPTTYLSIPSIHSGEVYQGNETVGDFYHKTVTKHSFVGAHAEKGYQGIVLNHYLGYCPDKVICGPDTAIYFKYKEGLSESALLLNLSVFKSVPHFVKRSIYNRGKWHLGSFSPSLPVMANYTLSLMASSLNTTSEKPTIKFIHLFGTHAPATVTATCKTLRKGPKWTRDLAIDQDVCGITHVTHLLKSLQENGIYDQTTILIIGDHGTGFSPPHQFVMGGSANPLFLFKPFHAKGDLKTSTLAVGLIDIAKTLCAETEDCLHLPQHGYSVLSLKPDQHRVFYFNQYRWSADKLALQKPFEISTFTIKGSVTDQHAWARDPVPALPFKKTISFVDPSFEKMLGTGWEKEGKTERWSNAREADFYLALPANNNVMLQFSVNTHAKNANQFLSVSANNVFLGKFAVSSKKPTLIQLSIPKTAITKYPTHLTFTFDQLNGIHKSYPLSVAFLGNIEIQNTA